MNNKIGSLVSLTLLVLCSASTFALEDLKRQTPIGAVNEQKLNVNLATIDQLITIKGLGERKAKAIINYIDQHGKISSLDELTNVKGIGNKLVAKLTLHLKAE